MKMILDGDYEAHNHHLLYHTCVQCKRHFVIWFLLYCCLLESYLFLSVNSILEGDSANTNTSPFPAIHSKDIVMYNFVKQQRYVNFNINERSSSLSSLSSSSIDESREFYLEAFIPIRSTKQTSYRLVSGLKAGWRLNVNEEHEILIVLGRSELLLDNNKTNEYIVLIAFSTSSNSCLNKYLYHSILTVPFNAMTLVGHIVVEFPYHKTPYFICVKPIVNFQGHEMFIGVGDKNANFPKSRYQDTMETLSQLPNDWYHQGNNCQMSVVTVKPLMPNWLMFCIIAVLLTVSGLFSGLNLGLMSLTTQDLEILIVAEEDSKIAQYAKKIMPVRKRGNFLLCTILLGNVLVNATATVMLEEIIDGIYAIIGSTIGIVILGEIIPQALCSRHGLLVGAKTLVLTKLFMVLTFPISYPLSKLLDFALGPDVGSSYTRRQILELVKQTTKDIEQHEMAIVAGALALKSKVVEHIMTPLTDVFMIDGSKEVNYDLMIEIYKEGFTRIPVYIKSRQNVVGLINIRDFAFIDLEGNMSVNNVCAYFNHPVGRVAFNANILDLLEEFKKGNYHIALVERPYLNNERKMLIGIITLEDIIEEIIQSQIYDEWDNVNSSVKQERCKDRAPDFSVFIRSLRDVDDIISAQQKIALFQYLAAVVPPFQPKYISQNVLRKLISNRFVFVEYKHTNATNNSGTNESTEIMSTNSVVDGAPDNYIYKYGKPADFFVMIIAGKGCLETGKERISSVVGPFSYFGTSALCAEDESIESFTKSSKIKPQHVIPDFSLKLVQDTIYLSVTRSVWIAAVRASAFEKQQSILSTTETSGAVHDFFTQEMNRAFAHPVTTTGNVAVGLNPNDEDREEKSLSEVGHSLTDEGKGDVNTAALPSYSSAGTNNSDSNERRLRFKSWQAASKIKNTVGIAESMHLLHKSQ